MAAGVTEIARMFPGLSIHIFGGASDGIGGRIRAKFGDIWCREGPPRTDRNREGFTKSGKKAGSRDFIRQTRIIRRNITAPARLCILGGRLKFDHRKNYCCNMASHAVSSLIMARPRKAGYKTAIPSFGEWLRQMREERNVPLRVVAAAAEMDQAHLSKAELGQRLLTAQQAAAIARYFKVDAAEMEARRIAEKFRTEYADNPSAAQAIQILHDASLSSGKKND